MAEQYGTTDDGYVIGPFEGSWAGARDGDTGGSVQAGSTSATNFTAVNRFASRGAGSSYRIERSFIYFDTSGITGTVASAQFELVGNGTGDGSIIAVKSTAFGGDGGTALAVEDFDAMPGWTDGASQAGNVTAYSAAFESSSGTWSGSGVNILAGTSDLLADMKNNDIVIVCFMDYTNDYLNVALGSDGTLNITARYTEAGGGQRPRIDYTLATGYTNAINGVAAANIGKVDGVATANIEKVIGV